MAVARREGSRREMRGLRVMEMLAEKPVGGSRSIR
jgi:hypothetical protein